MSTAAAPAAPMTGEEAEALLNRDIFVPAFFDKVASHGIQFGSEAEAVTALRMGHKLLAAERAEQVKAAGVRANSLVAAEQALDREIEARYGIKSAATVPTEDAGYLNKAAEHLGANPHIQNAVEAYNAAIAAEEALAAS